MCIFIADSLCCTVETNTTLKRNYTTIKKKKNFHIALLKMDNQQGPTVKHRELCSMLYGSLDGRRVWRRMDTCVCMAGSICCSPKTIRILLNWLRVPSHYACSVTSAVSDSVQPHGPQPTRLRCPWDSPGRNTGVGCHALFQGMFPTQALDPRFLSLLHWQAAFFTTSAT